MKRKQKTTKIINLWPNLQKKTFLELTNHLLIQKKLDKSAYVCMKHRPEKSHK